MKKDFLYYHRITQSFMINTIMHKTGNRVRTHDSSEIITHVQCTSNIKLDCRNDMFIMAYQICLLKILNSIL